MAQKRSYILAVNCGSSSIKFALFNEAGLECPYRGQISGIGSGEAVFRVTDAKGKYYEVEMESCTDSRPAIHELIVWLNSHYTKYPIKAIGHRIVQGGPRHRSPELITDVLMTELREVINLAPNHLPSQLAAIEILKNAFPEALQVACYDTCFHHTIPKFIRNYPLPEEYRDKDLIKYGFHGLSYEYVLGRLKKDVMHIRRKKIIIAHLGNGASMVAIKHGKSMDTTMGLTPMGGLLMGTRSGDIDPGVPIFMLKQWNLTADDLEEIFGEKSGLKAIAGTSDMQQLLALEKTDTKAVEAINSFVYNAKKNIGALAAALGGIDQLVFTGGIGENAATIRERVCDQLKFLGLKINKHHNRHNRNDIAAASSKVKIKVIPTNEESMVACHTQQLINAKIKKP